MKTGVMMFPTDKSIQPVELARACEERGFGCLWFPEHSHIPSSRKTPWGGGKDMPPLPEEYWRSIDLFVALAAAAAVTTNLELGSGICLAAQRDPLWLAKEVASLDHLSNGRFVFGVGYGWNKEEMANHKLAYRDRRAVLRENILACKAAWTEEEFSYKGDHLDIEPSWSWPKPKQSPHPPVLMGANPGPRTIADMAEFCDGWLPNANGYDTLGKLPEIKAAFDAAGRGDVFRWGAFGVRGRKEDLERMEEAGADWAVIGLPPTPADDILPRLDRYAQLL
jgi:probable F420-dependent oxidoreductase